MSLIELRGIGRRFGIDPPVIALADVSASIDEGEWVAVVGPSGSGKTTLLNILGLLDRPSSGEYRLGGQDVGRLPDGNRAGIRSREIGFVFQSFHLVAHRSVTENVMMADVYRRGDRKRRRRNALAAIHSVRLSHRVDHLPDNLSGGERQRVAIARAILGSPRVLLCDEPTGNLDTVTGGAILDLFAEMNRTGQTIVMITHDPSVAARAQRRLHIIDGRLMEDAV